MNERVATKTADLRLRLEPELKDEAARILASAGLDLSVAIRLFLRHVVVHRGLPFAVREPTAATAQAMREAQAIATPRFVNAQEVFDELEGQGRRKSGPPATKRRLHAPVRKGLARTAK